MTHFRHAPKMVALLLLASCATMPPVEPKIETREVRVPVPTRCIDPALVPAEPGTVTLPIDARLAADLAASQAKELRAWGRKLLAIIGPCTRQE